MASLSFQSVAASSSNNSPFGQKTTTQSQQGFEGAGSKLFVSQSSADVEYEEEDGPHFEPIISLPDKIEVKTGEENEEALFSQRAKLYRYVAEEKQWKERGVGDIKLLRNNVTGKVRVLMRREQVLKLCANHQITADMKLMPNEGSDRSWVWSTSADFSEQECKAERLAVRFKNKEIAQLFKVKFEECQQNLKDHASMNPPVQEETKEDKAEEEEDLFAELKASKGSWDCEVYCVRTESEKVKCMAYSNPKPGSEKDQDKTSSGKPLFGSSAPSSSTGFLFDSLLSGQGSSFGESMTDVSWNPASDNNQQQSDNSTATQDTKSEEIAGDQPSESCAQTRVEGKDSAEHQESNKETLRNSVEDVEQQREVATDGNKRAQSPFGALFGPNVMTDFSFRSSTPPGLEFVFEPSASPSSSKDTGTSVGKSATPSAAAKTIDNNKQQSDNSTATQGTKSEEIADDQPSESCAQTTVEGKDSAEHQESKEETLGKSVEDVEQQREVATDGNKGARAPFGVDKALFGPNVMTDFSFRSSTPPGSEFVFEPSVSPSSSKDTGTSVGKSATPSAAAKTIDNNKQQSDNSTATQGTKSEEIADDQPSESCAQTTVEGKDSAEHQESNEETLGKSVEDVEQQREVATDGNKGARAPFCVDKALFGPNVMTDFSFRSSTPPGSEFVFEPSVSPSSSKDTGTSVGKSATPSAAAKTIDNNKQQSDNSTATQGTKSEEIVDNQPSESCAQTTVEGKDSAEHHESKEETLGKSVEDVEQQREVATDGNKGARAPFCVDKALFGPNVMTDFSFRSSTPPGSEFVFEPSVSPSSSKDTGTSVGKSATPSAPQPGALPFPALFTLGTGEGFTDGKETLSQFSRPSQDSPVAPSGLSSPLASSGVSLMESDEVTRSAEMNQSDTNNELRGEEHCDVDQKESVVQEDPAGSVRSGASGPSKEKE